MEWLFFVVLVVVTVVVARWVLPAGKKYMALHKQVERERRSKPQGAPQPGPPRDTPNTRMRPASPPPPAATFPEGAVDLRSLESFRTRIKGTAYVVPDHQRSAVGGTTYALIREPRNQHDSNAIAVHDGRRRVGYVSAARAGTMAPILDTVGAPAYLVAGAGPGDTSVVLWMDLPKADALRRCAKRVTS